ncbi:MAG TPA: hypothetical protein VJX93_03115 [Candidatus Methanomethylophilaceae archaeon]|nr:hypothetical protein [Candidatus Methanomethylophilaceae archaeon]
MSKVQPIPAPDSGKKKILVVTNDSTVALTNKLESAGELYGGRVTEIRDFVKSIEKEFGNEGSNTVDVSFGLITTYFGFVPSTYCITRYAYAMSDKDQYQLTQDKRDYAGTLEFVSRGYDRVLICVPKEMFRILVDNNALHDGKIIAVTTKEFKGLCEERGWTYLERKGARLGKENAEQVRQILRDLTA